MIGTSAIAQNGPLDQTHFDDVRSLRAIKDRATLRLYRSPMRASHVCGEFILVSAPYLISVSQQPLGRSALELIRRHDLDQNSRQGFL